MSQGHTLKNELFWNKNKTFDIQILQCDLISLSQGHATQEKTLRGVFDCSSPSFQYSFLLSYVEQSLICSESHTYPRDML